MKLEIIEKQNDITFEIPKVDFPAYEEYIEKAEQIADYITSMEVSEDTIKEAKAVLSKARKLTGRLDGLRIQMEREILVNYRTVADKINEITRVVNRADSEMRSKVHLLEEIDRNKKKILLQEIWDKRINGYDDVKTYFPDDFNKWLKPSYLNKSTAVSACEKAMVEWLENRHSEIQSAITLGEKYLIEYMATGNLRDSIQTIKEREEIRDRVAEQQEEDEVKAIFYVYGEKDIALAEQLLINNNVEYVRF